jgi:hypothetical protein
VILVALGMRGLRLVVLRLASVALGYGGRSGVVVMLGMLPMRPPDRRSVGSVRDIHLGVAVQGFVLLELRLGT